MKKFSMKRAVKTYNNIMFDIYREHLTINTDFSENTDNWNLRDMVSECDYQLSTYYEIGHINESLRDGDENERKTWKSETRRLKRFINNYAPYTKGMEVTQGHCSKYDTPFDDVVDMILDKFTTK